MENKFKPRLLFYFVGLVIMAFGISLSIKSNFGVSPITSIPYTITLISGIDIGIFSISFWNGDEFISRP